jgi:hypothetical protein
LFRPPIPDSAPVYPAFQTIGLAEGIADGIEATLQIDPQGIDLPLEEVYRGSRSRHRRHAGKPTQPGAKDARPRHR